MEDWSRALEQRKHVDIIFFDLHKAFDSIDHERLMGKLNYFGFSHNSYNWLKNFLCDRTFKVKVNNSYSHNSPTVNNPNCV